MGDTLEELSERHGKDAASVETPMFKCVNGYVMRPRLTLSGEVEHVCPRCSAIIEIQPLEGYRQLRGHGMITVTCPRVTVKHNSRRRR